jgi:hypothetical protein
MVRSKFKQASGCPEMMDGDSDLGRKILFPE